MNQNIDNALKEAFGLIEAGNLEDAKALLRPILESEKDNADVWWLYSHAVTDADTARLALNNVLRIEPTYPDARDLLNQLEMQQIDSSDDILDIDKDPVFIPAMPSSVPGITALQPRADMTANKGFESSDELPNTIFDDEEPEAFYRRPLFYIPILSLLLIAALAIVIFKPFAVNSPAPEPTSQSAPFSSLETPTSASLSDGLATSTPIPVEVDTSVTTEALTDDLSNVLSAFAGYTISSDGGVSIVNASLGKTLNVSVCTSAGKEMRALLPSAMETLAKASATYADQVQIAAVKMLDCTTNSTLLWIGASVGDAIAFANGTISDKEFQAKWQPIK